MWLIRAHKPLVNSCALHPLTLRVITCCLDTGKVPCQLFRMPFLFSIFFFLFLLLISTSELKTEISLFLTY